jgi:hypothetical protein
LFACWLCCSCRPGGPTTLLTSMRHPCRQCYPYEQRVSARSLRCLVTIAQHVFLFSQAYVVFMLSHLIVRGRFVRGSNFMYKRLYSLFGLGSRCIPSEGYEHYATYHTFDIYERSSTQAAPTLRWKQQRPLPCNIAATTLRWERYC